jgi:hypothetical protein
MFDPALWPVDGLTFSLVQLSLTREAKKKRKTRKEEKKKRRKEEKKKRKERKKDKLKQR